MLAALELPYRVIDVAAGDLGSSAARKFDCEAWLPSQQRWLELTSTSNCTTLPGAPARHPRSRSRTAPSARWRRLNGTLVAMPRTIVALLENHQQPDGSVYVPAALQPHLGREVLSRRDVLASAAAQGGRVRSRRHARELRRLRSPPAPAPRWTGSARPGALLIFVTGRPPRWMTQVAEETGASGLAICANGAMVYDLGRGEVVRQHVLEADSAERLVEAIRAELPGVTFAVESGLRFSHEPAYVPSWPAPDTTVAEVTELLRDPVAKLLVRHPERGPDEIHHIVAGIAGDEANVTYSGNVLLEVSGAGISKASTLEALCMEHQIALRGGHRVRRHAERRADAGLGRARGRRRQRPPARHRGR